MDEDSKISKIRKTAASLPDKNLVPEDEDQLFGNGMTKSVEMFYHL